ncbi:MAG: energy transducer TonB [Saccharospirillum sp.]
MTPRDPLNTMVMLSDTNSLIQESRAGLTGHHRICLGALALSLVLHGGVLLAEFRFWQPPQSSPAQAQQVSLSLPAPGTRVEPENASAEPAPANPPDPVEPVGETAPPADPPPAYPEQPLEEAVVLTQDNSAMALPDSEPEAAPEPEPRIEPEPDDVGPGLTPAPQIPEPATTSEPPAKKGVISDIATAPAAAESATLADSAPSEPSFSDADRTDLINDYLQEIMLRLQGAFEYPSAALRRRQQGEVVLELMIESSGEIASVQLNSGSGFALLDDAALTMVRRLGPLPPLPEHLPDERLILGVPVVFRLQ